jgi:hypothetical protein
MLLTLMLTVAAFCGGWKANEWKIRREREQERKEARAAQKSMMVAHLAAMRAELQANAQLREARLKALSDRENERKLEASRDRPFETDRRGD